MTTKAHSTLTGSDLHEMKGAAAATINQVPIANGSGGTTFGLIPLASLQALANPFGAQFLYVREEQVSGTNGGASTNAWVTRTLNIVKTNQISGASLGSNQITLPAGTYVVDASAPACNTLHHQAKIKNITTSTDILLGTTEYTSGSQTRSHVNGSFVLSGTTVVELQHHQFNAQSPDGLGVATSFGTEVYSEVKLWKVA